MNQIYYKLFKVSQTELFVFVCSKDVLMFLTGQEEIESAVKTIRDITRSTEENMAPLIVCPLYAALPSHAQLKVFKPTPRVCLLKIYWKSFQI